MVAAEQENETMIDWLLVGAVFGVTLAAVWFFKNVEMAARLERAEQMIEEQKMEIRFIKQQKQELLHELRSKAEREITGHLAEWSSLRLN